jgi:lipopolysaccharide transport system permease protein
LGVFWAFVPPILMAVGFTYAINADIINVGETELPYAAHVMFSAVLWQTWRQG